MGRVRRERGFGVSRPTALYRVGALALLAAVTLLSGPAARAAPDADLENARRAFLGVRDATRLADALTRSPPDGPSAVVDAVLAELATTPEARPEGLAGDGYAALPSLVGALRALDLASADRALERLARGPAPAGLVPWSRALLAARHGEDQEAADLVAGDVDPVLLDLESSFRFALFGASLPVDDRLLLGAVAREALEGLAAKDDLAGVRRVAGRVAAFDRDVGARALSEAASAFRRAGRPADALALLSGPESACVDPAGTSVERAVSAWRAGRLAEARAASSAVSARPEGVWLSDALGALADGQRPPSIVPAPVSADPRRRSAILLARLASTLGVATRAEEVEARALALSARADDPGFSVRFLQERGLDASLAAGGEAAVRAAAHGLPCLLWRIVLSGDRLVEAPVLVRAEDRALAGWWVEPLDLRQPDLLPLAATTRGRVLVAVPHASGIPIASLVPDDEAALGRRLEEAVELARSDSPRAGAERLLARSSAPLEPVAALYAGWMFYEAFHATEDGEPIRRDAEALYEAGRLLEPIRTLPPPDAFVELAVARSRLADGDVKQAALGLDRAQAAAPESAWIALWRFKVLYDALSEPGPALEAIDLARRLDPLDVTVLYLRGRTQHERGELDLARRDLLRAFDRRPEWVGVALELVGIEIHAGRPRQALADLETLARHAPSAAAEEAVGEARREAESMLVQRASTPAELAALRQSPEPETRRRVAFALARFENDAAESALRALLADPAEAVRVTALRVYMRPWLRERVEADPALAKEVRDLLHGDASEAVRGAAAGLVSLLRVPWAAKELASALAGDARDAAPYPRSEAASALVRLDGPEARGALVEALDDDALTVRRAAIEALFRLASTYRGYDPEAPAEDRAPAVARWRAWARDGRG